MPSAPTAPGTRFPERRRVLLAACVGAFMSTLDMSIVNIALPQIARDLPSSLAQVSWVVVAYLLTNASFLLTSGRLGDLLAPGRLYFLGLLVFTTASALCGISTGWLELVASRALQGLGTSLILALAPKLIALSYEEGERGLPLGLFSTAFASGISIGAPLGGLITSHWGWPYIFFINIPICALALMAGGRPLARLSAGATWNWRAVDLGGSLTLAGSLGLLLLALNRLQDLGWENGWTLIMLGLAGGLFGLLLFLERRQTFPLLHPELWQRRAFCLAAAGACLAPAAVLGIFFLLPFFFEQIYHYAPDQTGFLLAVMSVTSGSVAPLGGRLADRLGSLAVLRTSSALILTGLGSFLFTGPGSSAIGLAVRLALIGIGFGLFHAPNLNEVLRGVPPALVGLAASTITVLKNIGTLFGITLTVTVFAWGHQHQTCLTPGVCLELSYFHLAFAVMALLGVINLVSNLITWKT
ncbi:MAG: MFS transporter [Deltaproteobacteria bacterium]|nr:MFS transporter [Deltaproteobacteria bacterium]MBW1952515.1 MFS transporter [Deltaproteobacteria bacterium]MBW1987276.1 MFS transporter [Deltaproteobacteria bacterium]MBW2135134.1 MFS transporter [Deltaproteobacteria bacterium]